MRTLIGRICAAAIVVALITQSASAQDEPVDGEGEVVGVIDGDTIDVLVTAETAMRLGFAKRKSPLAVRLRLDQVDTPERGQSWGKRAKEALSGLVFGKVVQFKSVEVDRYERDVALVAIGDTWVNSWLIEQGHGWAYRQYTSQGTLLCTLEDRARQARRGLWSQPPSTWQPPWLWRKHSQTAPFTPSLTECLAATRASR